MVFCFLISIIGNETASNLNVFVAKKMQVFHLLQFNFLIDPVPRMASDLPGGLFKPQSKYGYYFGNNLIIILIVNIRIVYTFSELIIY